MAIGNAIFKLAGVALVLPFLAELGPWIGAFEADALRQVVNFHTAFNLTLAVLFIGLTGVVGRLAARLAPDGEASQDPRRRHAISIPPRSRNRRSPSPPRRARRCALAMSWMGCCAG